MKKYAYLAFSFLVFFASCTPNVSVSTDYDSATNFRSLKTFGWYQDNAKAKSDTASYDTFFDKRMKKSIETQLKSHGLAYSKSNPDVYINYKAGFQNQQRYRSISPYGYGYGYPFGNSAVSEYKEGTITIDMVDPKKNELLWRGVGETEVSNRNISEEKVFEVVGSILRKYPPSGDRN